MSMKIAKKILAGTLALMNTFTAVSAEPVKVEKPTDSSISTKEDKKPNRESTKKKLAKGAAIAAGGVAVVAAAAGGIFALIRNSVVEPSANSVIESSAILKVSRKVFEWYLDPKVREYVEKYKNIKLGRILANLFDVLDKKELIDAQNIKENLKCVERYIGNSGSEFECSELMRVLNEEDRKVGYRNFKYLTISNIWILPVYVMSGQDMHSFCVNNIDLSELDSAILIRMFSSDSKFSYDLKAIFMCDEENCYFTTAYVKYEDDTWHIHSFDGIKEESFDEDFITSMLANCHRKVNLFYVKSNK